MVLVDEGGGGRGDGGGGGVGGAVLHQVIHGQADGVRLKHLNVLLLQLWLRLRLLLDHHGDGLCHGSGVCGRGYLAGVQCEGDGGMLCLGQGGGGVNHDLCRHWSCCHNSCWWSCRSNGSRRRRLHLYYLWKGCLRHHGGFYDGLNQRLDLHSELGRLSRGHRCRRGKNIGRGRLRGRDGRPGLLGVGVRGHGQCNAPIRLPQHLWRHVRVVLVRLQVLRQRPRPLEAPRAQVALVAEVAVVPPDVQLELPLLAEPLSAEVALEGQLARVPADVDLVSVPVGVLSRAVLADERLGHLVAPPVEEHLLVGGEILAADVAVGGAVVGGDGTQRGGLGGGGGGGCG